MEPLFARISGERSKKVAKVVTFTATGVVVALVANLFLSAVVAEGSVSPRLADDHAVIEYCVEDNGDPCYPVKAGRWFKNRYDEQKKMGRYDFSFSKFANPRQARKMLRVQIANRLANNSVLAKQQGIDTTAPDAQEQIDATARSYVRRLERYANCGGDPNYIYPYNVYAGMCTGSTPWNGFPKETIKKVGTVAFCAGSVVASFTAVGKVTKLIGFEALGCSFTAWVLFD